MSIQNKVYRMTDLIAAERGPAPRPQEVPPLVRPSLGASPILFGKPTAAFSGSPATNVLELDPCDLHGTDNGQANITAYLQPSQANYALTNSTTIPVTAICPYIRGGDGYYYLLGNPIEIVTDVDVDGANEILTKKTRNVWVLTIGEESAAVTFHTGDDCSG
jgi:hypothetical protein